MSQETMTLAPNNWLLLPTIWPSWNFTVKDSAGMLWGKIIFPSLYWLNFPCPCAHGTVAVGEQQYTVSRQGIDDPFVLSSLNGNILATASEPRPSGWSIFIFFESRFAIQAGGRMYQLQRIPSSSWWRTAIGLFAGNALVGQIEAPKWISYQAQVSLPEDMPKWAMAFVMWLTLLIWRREMCELS